MPGLFTATFLFAVISGKSLVDRDILSEVILACTAQGLSLIVEKHEVELLFLQIGTGNLDVDVVAETVTVVMATTHETMVLLVVVMVGFLKATQLVKTFVKVVAFVLYRSDASADGGC